MQRLNLLLATICAGAIMMTGAGCAETHSSEPVAYTTELPDNFNWSAYQAIPESERGALAPLQKEWLELVDRSLNDFRAAYAAKNAVARDALISDAVERQKTSYDSLIKRIETEGLNNWAFRVSDEGLVMGPAVVFDYWTTGSFLNTQVHYRVSQSFLLKVQVDWQRVTPDARQVIGNTNPGEVVYASLPPGSFEISLGNPSYGPFVLTHRVANDDPLPALAAPRRWLSVVKHDRLRLASGQDPQLYKQLLADKSREDAEAQANLRMQRDAEVAAHNKKIATLHDKFVHYIYSHDVSPSAVRRWLGRSFDSDSYLDDKPEPNSLAELKRLGHPLEKLLQDKRVAFAVALEPADKSKLAALVDAKTMKRDFFGGEYYSPLADEASRQLKLLVRRDVDFSKMLIDADGLSLARVRATESGRLGHLWMTRLAQLSVLWEQGDAIVISPSEQNVQFAEGSLAEHLKSLPHERSEFVGGYSTPAMQHEWQARGANFANFDYYLDAARRGEFPQQVSVAETKAKMVEERNRRSLEARQRRSGR